MDEELHLGNDDGAEIAEGVSVVLTSQGRAVLAPRSVRALRGEALEVAAELERAVLEVEAARARAYQLAGVLRELGASWAAIGWCMGVSEARVRQIVAEL